MENKIYLIMNKPCNYVCKAEADRHKTVYELLPPELQSLVKGAKRGERLHTVGRLDCNTSGLLLLTTDGQFSHKLTEPQNKITKTYVVELKNPVSPEKQKEYIQQTQKGILLPAEKKAPEEMSAPAKIVFDSPLTCTITVTEGKFHEVRRIFQALGNEVTSLKRIAINNFFLPDNLLQSQYRALTTEELRRLI